MGIHRSLAMGNEGEVFISDLFKFAEIECEKHTDVTTRQEHDLTCKIGRTKFTCEVKFDAYAERSGNWCLEHWNSKSNKASGITGTKATIWCVVLKDGDNKVGYACSVKKLREFVESTAPFKKISRGGDGNAELMLYKHETIVQHFTRIDNVKKEELHNIVKKLIKENK